jgi:hypothetical protein
VYRVIAELPLMLIRPLMPNFMPKLFHIRGKLNYLLVHFPQRFV